MTLTYSRQNVVLGAGRFFIDRYEENGKKRGIETYIGDTTGATLGATTERTTIFSGDGAVATKLIDKVTQVDRTLGITPQDATLDNMALFMIAARPAAVAAGDASSDLVTDFDLTADVTERDYFQLGSSQAAPAARPKVMLAADVSASMVKGGDSRNTAVAALTDGMIETDRATGRIRFIGEGPSKINAVSVSGKIKVTVPSASVSSLPAFERVSVTDESKQVRVAVRYVEDADEGVEGRNIYIPQASVSPAGEAALKSRDTPQQFPITLAIEKPDTGLAQVYIDGVPA